MNTKEVFGKFVKGAVSGGGVALTAFLGTNGCRVDDLQAFGYAAGLAVVSGAFHAVFNMYIQKKTP